MSNDFLWVEKYRPKKIEHCILPSDVKETFKGFVKQGEIPNLLLSGTAGVGKTTIAVNLSIALKKIASEIFLLDTDLGMANSHVLLGVNPGLSLSDVISTPPA